MKMQSEPSTGRSRGEMSDPFIVQASGPMLPRFELFWIVLGAILTPIAWLAMKLVLLRPSHSRVTTSKE